MYTVKDFQVKDKVVIVRSDLNVPLEDGVIKDDTRIKESMETISYLVNKDAKVVVLSHLGRVKEEADKEKYSLAPIAKRMNELIYENVTFVPFTRGLEVEEAIKNMPSASIIVLENTRFEDLDGNKESGNDEELGKYWASLGSVFINDAFGTAHRAHASNAGIAKWIPSGVGILMKKELDAFKLLTDDPKRPFVVVMGGAKIKDKIPLIESLLQQCDKLLISGGMSYTFFKAQGLNMGRSIIDEESIDFCKRIMEEYKDKIVLPVDINVGSEFSTNAVPKTRDFDKICESDMGLDTGAETLGIFAEILNEAKTVFWNGPMGVFEFPRFNKGTLKLGEILGKTSANVIVGGGDTVRAINDLNIPKKFYHISTGGGAALELLEGKPLPAIEAITKLK